MNKYHLELKRANVIVSSEGGITNAVWGTIIGDIKQQTDLQAELAAIKESIPEPYNDAEIKEDIASLESTKADKTDLVNLATKEELATKADASSLEDLATKKELNSKQDTLVSGTTIKTINSQSLLGEGNIEITSSGSITVDNELSTTSENPVQNKVITAAINSKQDAGDYALKSELPDTNGLATKTELIGKLDVSTYNEDKSTFALKSELPDTSAFATKTELTDGLAAKLDSSTYSTDKPTFALKTEIPDTSNLATKEELNSKANISDVYTKTEVDSKIDEAITGGEVDLSNYYTRSETYSKAEVDGKIPDISGLATKEELNTKVSTETYNVDKTTFALKSKLSNLATKAELPTATSDLTNDSGYITSIPDEYITETELESKGYAINSTVTSTYATKEELAQKIGNIDTLLDNINGEIV